MLMNVKEALKTGMNVELELLFKHGGTIKVDAIVKE
jgi:copper(I)-binding protein